MSIRPYRGSGHLWSVAECDAGRIAVWPICADSVHVDAAKANHIPTHAHEGEHGSTVLDIGRGVGVRVSGNLKLIDGRWKSVGLYFSRDHGGDVTRAQADRATVIVEDAINAWAATRAGDIAQADDIDRNNAARTLEENIAHHVNALKILRRELRACENGREFTQYPDLPTSRR